MTASQCYTRKLSVQCPTIQNGHFPAKTTLTELASARVFFWTDRICLRNESVSKFDIEACIRYKAYYDKNVNTPQLRKREFIYVLERKTDHQGSKNSSTKNDCIDPYLVEVGHPMGICLFEPVPDVPATSHVWKFNHQMVFKHDELEARARFSEKRTAWLSRWSSWHNQRDFKEPTNLTR